MIRKEIQLIAMSDLVTRINAESDMRYLTIGNLYLHKSGGFIVLAAGNYIGTVVWTTDESPVPRLGVGIEEIVAKDYFPFYGSIMITTQVI